VPQPPELGFNGSFVAFRILAQDCHGFEQFLDKAAAESGLDRELIAAKLCGRWRNGVPLAPSPDTSDAGIPLEKYNSFDYVPTETMPDAVDDRKGYRCPIGAHIRRMNPRNSTVAGNSGLKRRIIRRGLPYGPPYDPDHPDDGIERGLLGLFIGVSLKDQFEFVMSDWVNKGTFAPGLGDTKDPVLGDNSSADSTFRIPVKGQKAIVLTGLSRFVHTRGSAYCFLPSETAVRYLADLPARLITAKGTTAAAGTPGA
jgi:deferrochelatase/peroxidase EfeB